MDIYKIKWTRLQAEIFRLLTIKTGQALNVRGIAKLLKKSPTAVSHAMVALKKEGLITVKKLEHINALSIEFNRDSRIAVDLKRVENLKLIYESDLVAFLEERFPGCTVVLFGSYSRGEDVWVKEGHKSDIDIAVIGSERKQVNLREFEEKLEREININFYDSYKEVHKNLRDNILNGIILSGSVEL